MFLELINDLFISSSVFYAYFGILLLTVGFSQLFILHHHVWKTQTDVWIGDYQYITLDHLLYEQPILVNERIIIWFVKTFKKINKRDDDEEDESASYLNNKNIRGGQLWGKTTYSQPLGTIILLF